MTLQRGVDITKSSMKPGPVPVVSSGGISGYHSESVGKGPGVVIGRKGTLGKTYFLDCDYWPHDTTLWVRDFKGNYPRFVYYFLLGQDFTYLDVGSANPTLNRNHVHPIRVWWPPLDVQRRIAAVLGALDDLIESNERVALASGLLAQKTWDFAFADQEHNTRVADVGTVVLGGTPSRKESGYWGGSIPWLNSGKANDFRVIEPSEFITEAGLKASSTKYMPKGTTLIAITGATLGQVSRTEMAACGNQSLVGLYADPPAANDYLFCAVVDGIDRLTRNATGGAQQHINKGDVEDFLIARPSLSEIEHWHGIAAPLLEASGSLLVEARLLRQTRDELLPLLMTGRVSPGEVDLGV